MESSPRVVSVGGHEFESMPWLKVTTQSDETDSNDEYYWEIDNTVTPYVPNPYYNGDTCKRESFPNSITLYSPKRETAREVAIDFIACLMVQEMHEGLEWTTVDGERLAETHPEFHGGDFKYWDEMREDLTKVVKRYIRKHPLKRTSPD